MTGELSRTGHIDVAHHQSGQREVFRYTGVRLLSEAGIHYMPNRRALAATFAVIAPVLLLEIAIVGAASMAAMGKLVSLLLSIFLVAVLVGLVHLRNGRLSVDEIGIYFPSICLLHTRGRLNREWQDLEAIDVDTQKPPYSIATSTAVLFKFKDGSVVPVDLTRMTQEDVHSFRNALVRWSPVSHPSIADMAAIYENEKERFYEFSRAQFNLTNRSFTLGAYDWARESEEIGQYKILQLLAGGHASALYLAVTAKGTQVRLREFVVPDECSDKQSLMEKLLRSADGLAWVNDDRICSILDSFATADRFYYVLEDKGRECLCELLDYDVFFQRNPFDYRIGVAAQMAKLIALLHSEAPPVVHGHVYPGVFRFDKNKSVYLADFGFAQSLITRDSGLFYGDLSYAAPEQLNGQATTASDVYGLAATIFYLYTGKDPRPLCPSTLSLHGIKVPRRLDDLITRCTAYSAGDRPSSADMAEELQGLGDARLKMLEGLTGASL